MRNFVPASGRGWRPNPATRIVVSGDAEALIDEAQLLSADLAAVAGLRRPPAVRLGVTARSPDIELFAESHAGAAGEAYQITAAAGTALRLHGAGTAGLYYAGRTPLQLVRTQGGVPSGTIADAPDRPERGIMMDIGRKPYPLAWLTALIETMGWLKLNMLHLHVSDNEGYRLESRVHPQISSAPSLSIAEVEQLVKLATRHHITIVPELDAPGHLGHILKSFPQLALRDVAGRGSGRALDVSNPAAVNLIRDLDSELLSLFPGDRWHIGADEVLLSEPGASGSTLDERYPHLVRYAESRVGTGANAEDAFALFVNDRNRWHRARGKTCRAWNDGMQSLGKVTIDPDIDVLYWENLGGNLKTAEQHIAEGHRV